MITLDRLRHTQRTTCNVPCSMTESLPRSNKDICLAVTDATEVSREEFGNDNVKGHEVSCVNCKKRSKFMPRSQGLASRACHWKRRVKEQAVKARQERLRSKNSTKGEATHSPTSNDQAALIDPVKFRAIANWHRSLHAWVEKITKLNQPANTVENKIEREHVED